MKALALIGVVTVLFLLVETGTFVFSPTSSGGNPFQDAEGQSPLNDEDRREITLRVCSACHGLSKLSGEIISAGRGLEPGFELFEGVDMVVTPRDWSATVTRMKELNGCNIQPFEEPIVVEWLDKYYGKNG